MFTDLTNFIPASLYLLILALWVIGYMIKQAKFIKDAYIPFILTIIAIIFALIIEGLTATAILQGIICAAISVYGKNLVMQTTELFDLNKKEK